MGMAKYLEDNMEIFEERFLQRETYAGNRIYNQYNLSTIFTQKPINTACILKANERGEVL